MMFYSINFFEKYLEGIRKRYTFALAKRKNNPLSKTNRVH